MKSNLINILKKELKELFRDRKSLAMMLIIPIMIPLMVIGMSALLNMEMNTPIDDYNKIGFAYELSDAEKSILEEMEIEYFEDNEESLEEKYDDGELDLYVTREDKNYILNGNTDNTSNNSLNLVNSYFDVYKEFLQNQYLSSENINPNEVLEIISVTEDIKSSDKSNYFVSFVTTYGFLFIIMAITISATYPATDATAGEKERGTLETLLTFPIKAKDIILGKFLSVSISSIITGLLSLILMIVAMLIANNMFEIYENVDLMLSGVAIVYSVFVILAYSFLISGLCIAIASKSKTFKEAQSALTPITFISFFPGMIAFLSEVNSSFVLSLVPFLNFTLLFEDIVAGSIDILNIFGMIVSTILVIIVVLGVIIKQYKSEKILF